MKKKYILLILLFCLIVCGGVIGYVIYNKPHRNIVEAKAYKVFNVKNFIEEFKLRGETIHNTIFDKVIEIRDIHKFALKKADSGAYILIVPDDSMNVSLYFKKHPFNNQELLDTHFSIKGIYKGYIAYDTDFDVSGEIKITQTIIIN